MSELVGSVASGVTVSGSLKMAQISAMARNVAGRRSVDGRSRDGALVSSRGSWQGFMTGLRRGQLTLLIRAIARLDSTVVETINVHRVYAETWPI